MTDLNSDTTNGASGDVTFGTFDEALRRWGRYDPFPNKVQKATEVFDALVADLGPPQRLVMLGSSETYIRTIWKDPNRVFYCHYGFLSWNLQLEDSWVPGNTAGRWEYRFPDFKDMTRQRVKAGPVQGSCFCMPGVQHPVGTNCPYCDEPITA